MQHYNNSLMKFHLKVVIKFLLKISLFLFWMFLLFAFDQMYLAILTAICAILHEIGHILCACLVKKEIGFSSAANGFRIKSKKNLSYVDEIIIGLGGPITNIVLFLFLRFFGKNPYLHEFAILNLFTAISNLIPIEGYDGYRIINCTLKLSGSFNSELYLSHISFGISVSLCFIALFFILKIDYGYWIYFIFLFSLFKKIQSTQRLLFARKREISRDFKRFQEICQSESGNKCE